MNRIWGLDLLRAIAIIAVLLFHSLGFMKQPNAIFHAVSSRGWSGVDLFFVLSGFLVGGQLLTFKSDETKASQIWTFLVKRWTRTFPLYYAVLFFYVVLKPVVFKAPFKGFDWPWLFFLQNLNPIYDFGQTWSLCVEEQFYILFPFVTLLFHRFKSVIWLLPLFLSVSYRWFMGKNGLSTLSPEQYLWTFRFPFISILDSISMGVFLAKTYSHWSNWSPVLKKACAMVGGIITVVTLIVIPEIPVTQLGATLLYLFLAIGNSLMLIYFESIKTGPKSLKPIQNIALWSYSAYLIHPILIRFFDRYFQIVPQSITLCVYLGLVYVISKYSYEWLEVNGMKLRKIILSKK